MDFPIQKNVIFQFVMLVSLPDGRGSISGYISYILIFLVVITMVIPICNLNCTPKYKAGPVFTIAVLVNTSRTYFTFGFMVQGGATLYSNPVPKDFYYRMILVPMNLSFFWMGILPTNNREIFREKKRGFELWRVGLNRWISGDGIRVKCFTNPLVLQHQCKTHSLW